MGSENGGLDGEFEAGSVRQPLPPEVPVPRTEEVPPAPPLEVAEVLEPEWWAKSAPPDAAVPGPRVEAPAEAGAESAGGVPGEAGPEQAAVPWWSVAPPGPDLVHEGREESAAHGQGGVEAAVEIGAHIGEAISAHLPAAQAGPEQRRLDLRWLRLRLNVPGALLALMVTWGGSSGTDRMAAAIAEDGIFAPVGWVLLPFLLVGILMVLPIGSWLGEAVSHLVAALAHGVARLARRAWRLPVLGYLMRLLVAVIAWSFVFAVLRLLWRWAVHVLTGA